MDERGRSTEEIRQDLAREEANLSRTAHQIGDRIKEKLDWSEYVKDSPYWSLGIAAGIGFFASRVLKTRTTPMERIMGPLAEEVRTSLGGLHLGAARPGLAQVILLGIGTKLAAGWLRNGCSTSRSSGGVRTPSQAEHDSTINPETTT
ncbi:MAG: hypothetical protein EG822_06125 [Deltaproteobacteria bacterium]|nr:hypothetical protein [Deltaproteobacteria bacterium]TLN04946.1 MAG: hypothetical protein FDZ73_01420 [bacterium]